MPKSRLLFALECPASRRLGAVIAIALTLALGGAHAQNTTVTPGQALPAEPQWKSSPFHGVMGGDGKVIPCRCLFQGNAYKLGEKVCMNTPNGTVLTECDLQQNNTSWVPTNDVCTIS
jgi:hypothetical protein